MWGRTRKLTMCMIQWSLCRRIWAYSCDKLVDILFPEHFSEEQGLVIGFLLKETPISLFFNLILFPFVSALFNYNFLSRLLKDSMLLSFQPSKSAVGLFGFWLGVWHSKSLIYLGHSLVMPGMFQMILREWE